MSTPINVPAHEHEQRFDLASWLVLLFALSLIGLSLAQVLYRIGLPSDGWSAEANFFGPEERFVFGQNVSAAPFPLQSGDVLLAIEGQSVDEILRRALTLAPQPPPNWQIGESVRYTVLRDGRTLNVWLLLARRPSQLVISSILSTLLTDPSVFPSIFIGLFVFFMRPRNRAARLLLLLTACFFASDGISHPAGGLLIGVSDLFYVGAYWPSQAFDKLIWSFIIAPVYIQLFLVFPVATMPVRRYPRLTLAILYLTALAMLLAAYITQAGQAIAFWRTWSSFTEIYYFLVLGTVIVAMGHALLRVQEPTHRAQIRWVAAGTLVTSLGAVAGGVIAVMGLRGQYPLLDLAIYRLPFVAFPLGVAVAVLRHRMFDIDVIINRTLVYIPLTAILAGLYAASITVSQKLFVSFTGQQSDAAAVLTTLIVVAAFSPAKDRLQAIVDRRFREGPDPSKKLRIFEQEVKTRAAPVEAPQAIRRLLQEATSAFGANSGAAYVGNGSSMQLVCSIGHLEGEPALKAPLEIGGTRIGMIYLGNRSKGAGYPNGANDLLVQVAATVARAIQEDSAAMPASAASL